MGSERDKRLRSDRATKEGQTLPCGTCSPLGRRSTASRMLSKLEVMLRISHRFKRQSVTFSPSNRKANASWKERVAGGWQPRRRTRRCGMKASLYTQTMATLERALQIAVQAHAGQRDKSGAACIFHPIRVMTRCTSTEAQIVGLLHDVVEDTSVTFAELAGEGFSKDAMDARPQSAL